MYVLVLVMIFQGETKVKAFDPLFPDWRTCKEVAVSVEKRLMRTRPSPNAVANTYCLQLPKDV